jgi:hypothetical protein
MEYCSVYKCAARCRMGRNEKRNVGGGRGGRLKNEGRVSARLPKNIATPLLG